MSRAMPLLVTATALAFVIGCGDDNADRQPLETPVDADPFGCEVVPIGELAMIEEGAPPDRLIEILDGRAVEASPERPNVSVIAARFVTEDGVEHVGVWARNELLLQVLAVDDVAKEFTPMLGAVDDSWLGIDAGDDIVRDARTCLEVLDSPGTSPPTS